MALVETIEVELKGTGIESLIASLNKVADACEKTATAAGSVGKATSATAKGVKSVSDESVKAAKSMIETQTAIQALTAKYNDATMKLAEMIEAGNASEGQMASQAAKCQDLVRAINKYNESAQQAAKESSGIQKAIGKVSKAFGTLGKSILRIAFYRIIRSIIKTITDMAKEGLENLYRYSQATGTSLAKNFDKMASSWQKLKNQFGAALGTLIEAIMPALLKLIELFISLAEKITRVFALLSGKNGYYKAKDVTKEWMEDTKEGAKAAEEWKNQLLGFDEINRLEDNRNNNDDDDDDENPEDLFEWIPLDNYKANIMDMLDDIGNYCIHITDGIMGKFNELKRQLQEQLAPAFQTALQWLANLLASLLTSLNELAQGVAERLGEIGESFARARQSVSGAVEQALQAIRDALARVGGEIEMQAVSLGQALAGVWDGFLSSAESNLNLASQKIRSWCGEVKESVSTAFEGIGEVTATVLQTIGSIIVKSQEAKYETITSGMEAIAEFGSKAWEAITEFASAVGEFLSGVWDSFIETLEEKVKSAVESIQSIVEPLTSWFSERYGYTEEVMPNGTVMRTYEHDLVEDSMAATASIMTGSWIAEALGGLGVLGGLLPKLAPILGFASGGTPATGSLFLAGERGAELVSTAGGSTTVSNQDQIANSVASGNENVVNAIFAMANAIVNSVDSKDMNTYLDGKQVAYGLQKYNTQVSRNYGKNLVNIY